MKGSGGRLWWDLALLSVLSSGLLFAEDKKKHVWPQIPDYSGARSEDFSEADDFQEDRSYALYKPIQIYRPLANQPYAGMETLARSAEIRIIEAGTMADLCNPKTCSAPSQQLVNTIMQKGCDQLTAEELSIQACGDPRYHLVIHEGAAAGSPNCFCTAPESIRDNIEDISAEDSPPDEIPEDMPWAGGQARPVFVANATQFVAVDSSGREVYTGYIHPGVVASLGSRTLNQKFNAFAGRFTKMGNPNADYFFAPDMNNIRKGLIGGTMYRRLHNGTYEPVNLRFYTSRSNIPAHARVNVVQTPTPRPVPRNPTPAKPAPAKPSPVAHPTPPPPAPTPALNARGQEARRLFVQNLYNVMPTLTKEITHAESAVLKGAVDSGLSKTYQTQSSNRSHKPVSQKGLCWRYAALGTHLALGLGAYLPARPPSTNYAKNADKVMTRTQNGCGQPLFRKIAIPEAYTKLKRNALLEAQKGALFKQFIKDYLQQGDLVVWNNSSRAGHIEFYLPQGNDDSFFSDYRGDLDQDDGNPDRPGGRSTNNLGYILRYNPC